MQIRLTDLRMRTKLIFGMGVGVVLGLVSYLYLSSSSRAYMRLHDTELAWADQAISSTVEASNQSKTMAAETMMYVYTTNQSHWNKKIQADEKAGAAFDEATRYVKKLPGNEKLLASLEPAGAYDDEVCNPLENKIMGMAKEGRANQAQALFESQYMPARASLEKKIAGFQKDLAEYQRRHAAGALAAARGAMFKGWALQGVVVLFSLAMMFLISRAIMESLNKLSGRMKDLEEGEIASLRYSVEALADGDLTRDAIVSTDRIGSDAKDEFGDLSRTFDTMLAQLQATTAAYQSARSQLVALVSGVARQADGVSQTSSDLALAATSTADAATGIAYSIHQVSEVTADSATAITEIAAGSEQLARDASNVTSAMVQLEETIETVQQGSRTQQSATNEAAQIVEQGGLAVSKTIASIDLIQQQVSNSVVAVQELGEKQKQIGEIVKTIEGIASQTNLLALNAAIEAARAGEQGKGFAVVADEVRKLAVNSTLATQEIATLIDSVTEMVDRATAAMDASVAEVENGQRHSDEGRAALTNILQSVTTVRELAKQNEGSVLSMANLAKDVSQSVQEVAAVSEETAANTQKLSASSEEVSATTEEVHSSIERQTAAMQEVNATAQSLKETAGQLQKMVGQFRYDEEPSPMTHRRAA